MAKKSASRIFTMVWKIFIRLNKHINFLMGSISGFATGSIVFFINYEHGFTPALYSFFRQFSFNLLMGGFNIRVCEKITQLIEPRKRAIITATIIPSIQAFIILYSIHYFGHTPKPGASTFWQFGTNLIIFFFMALFYRDKMENKEQAKLALQKAYGKFKNRSLTFFNFRKDK